MNHRMLPTLAAAGILACLVATAAAQIDDSSIFDDEREAGISFDGVHLEGGLNQPLRADDAAILGGAVHLGTVFTRWLDWTVGARRWASDLDKSRFDLTDGGRIRDFLVYTGLEYGTPGAIKGMRPLFGVGVAAHMLAADIPEKPALDESLDGFRAGAWGSVGLATSREGLGLRLQARRDFVEQAGGWSYTLGVGWWPHQHAAESYESVPYVPAYVAPPTPAPLESAPRPDVVAALPPPIIAEEPDAKMKQSAAALDQLTATARDLQAQVENLERTLAAKRDLEAAAVPEPAPEPVVPAGPTEAELRAIIEQELARAAQVAGDATAVRREVDQLVVSLGGSLTFVTGSDALELTARETLRRVAAVMLQHPGVRTVIEGHTDSVGDAERNRMLSLSRASAVRDELRRLGVSDTRLGIEGFGESRPLEDNATKEGRAINRRVDLRFNIETSTK